MSMVGNPKFHLMLALLRPLIGGEKTMKYRPLGTSGILVSEIGFGGWGIGGVTPGPTSYGPTDDNESQRALESAFDRGITYYDTAGVYGKSEELIGKTFKHRRGKVVIGTKVGFLEHHTPQDF